MVASVIHKKRCLLALLMVELLDAKQNLEGKQGNGLEDENERGTTKT